MMEIIVALVLTMFLALLAFPVVSTIMGRVVHSDCYVQWYHQAVGALDWCNRDLKRASVQPSRWVLRTTNELVWQGIDRWYGMRFEHQQLKRVVGVFNPAAGRWQSKQVTVLAHAVAGTFVCHSDSQQIYGISVRMQHSERCELVVERFVALAGKSYRYG